MKRKIIYGLASLVSIVLAIMYAIAAFGNSNAAGARAEAANTTQYILMGLFCALTIVFIGKMLKNK